MQRIIIRILVLIGILGIGYGMIGPARVDAGQGPDLTPPRILDLWPAAGVTLASGDPVTVTFDQPMNKTRVETAIHIAPSIPGTFSWQDAQTVVFAPSTGWPGNTTLRLTIDTSAKSAEGTTLADATSFDFETMPDLKVAQITPQDKTEDAASNSKIIVAFDRPIVPLTTAEDTEKLPSPIQIDPSIDGKGEWVNTALYVFTPNAPLPGGKRYKISIPSGLKASDGSILVSAVTSTFQVAHTQVSKISTNTDDKHCQPDDTDPRVGLDCPISVSFSEPMDRASTEVAFSVAQPNGSAINGTFTWADDSQSFVFKPSLLLQPAAKYIIKVVQSAQNKLLSGGLDHDEIVQFTSVPLPSIVTTSPQKGETATPGSGVQINFPTYMKFSTIKSRLHIRPTPRDLQLQDANYDYSSIPDDRVNSVMASFVSLPNTKYTVTLDAGAEDIYGNTISQSTTFSFSTGDPVKQPPAAYPVLNGTIMTTGIRNGNAQIAMMVRGKLTVHMVAYALTTEAFKTVLSNFQFGDYCRGSDGTMGYENGLGIDVSKLKPWREWDQPFNENDHDFVRHDISLAAPGTIITPGLYYVRAGKSEFVLSVATANITLKRSDTDMLAWVTDSDAAKPLANVNVTLYNNTNSYTGGKDDATTFPLGKTDANGIVRVDVSKIPKSQYYFDDTQQYYVVAQGQGVYGAWYSCNYANEPYRQAYLYTDRPIYRPGETVYFKGIVRAQNDETFTPLPRKIAHIDVSLSGNYYGSDEGALVKMDLPINSDGTFAGEFTLPADATIGTADINLSYPEDTDADINRSDYYYYGSSSNSVSFTIADFRPPDFEVQAQKTQTEIIQGDPLKFDASATYYSGGAVNNAQLQWKVYSEPGYFDYKGKGDYVFDDERWPYYFFGDQDSGGATTDANGEAHITSTKTVLSDTLQQPDDGLGPGDYRTTQPFDPAPGKRPTVYIGEATITDEAGEPVSSRTEAVIAHPANVYVGISSPSWEAPMKKPLSVQFIAVRPDSSIIVGQSLQVTVSQFSWKLSAIGSYPDEVDGGNPQWVEVITPVAQTTLKTSADGIAKYSFTPASAGLFRVAVQTADEQGRINSATQSLYVSGDAESQWNDPLLEMTPTTDKKQYNPGDTATIRVPIGFAGRSLVLVTVERSGIITSDVVEVNNSVLTYKLPITDSYAPGVFVSFTAYRGRDATHPDPDYRTGQVEIKVTPLAKRLKVSLTPSTTLTRPQGTVSFNVLVTDVNGNPVSAQVGLALVDKSVLALVEPNTVSLEDAFYSPPAYDYVHTTLSMYGYMPLITNSYIIPCCFGGGGGPPGPLAGTQGYVRSNFKFTALWSPFVQTDKDGKASVTVTLPDNATTWHLDARAVTADTMVGDSSTELIASLPLLMRPVTPRFMVAGDKVQLAAVINNNTGKDQSASVGLTATGVTLLDPTTQKVMVPNGGRVRVTWNVQVNSDAQNADLVFSVTGQDGIADAARPLIATGPGGTIPIYRYLAYDNVATSGSLFKAGTNTEQVRIPANVSTDQGRVTLHYSASLAAATLDSLNYLQLYPYDCVEQTVSKFLPNIFTLQALKKLNVNDPTLTKALDDQIQGALNKLTASRNQDGGWGWFPGQPTDPLITAYAVLAITEARDAGYSNYASASDTYPIANQIIVPDASTAASTLNRQAFYEYVIARFDQVAKVKNDEEQTPTNLGTLYARRASLSDSGRAFLLMALEATSGPQTEISTLASDLESTAISTATSVHWESPDVDWQNWDSNTRMSALALRALIMGKPDSPLLPGAVRWLMNTRHADHWETTQETVWSLAALTDWMVKTNELNGTYSYQTVLNGNTLQNATVVPGNVRDPKSLSIDVKKFLTDRVNTLMISRGAGDGALYYTANLNLYEPADQVKAISRGVTIARQYFAGDKSGKPIQSAKLSDVITVRLTFTVNQDMRYFLLEDPFPAGTEAVDTSLNTTSIGASGPDFTRTPDGGQDWDWYWGWWYIDHMEIRDQQIDLYASYLPRGTYTFSYQLRATVAGVFQTMPTHGYPFYYPDIFGRSDGTRFTILDDQLSF